MNDTSVPDSFLGVSSRLLLVPVLVVGGLMFNTGARLLAPSADDLLLHDPREPVLFLRSFGDDELKVDRDQQGAEIMSGYLTMSRYKGNTFEEVIASIFSEVGPVIAVGEPGRTLHPLGAARLELSNDEWQEKVRHWILCCRYIALMLGRTDGLLWELRTISEMSCFQKLIVVFPPLPAAENITRWGAAQVALAEAGVSVQSNELAPTVTLATFGPSGKLRLLAAAGRNARSYRDVLAKVIPGIKEDWELQKQSAVSALWLLVIIIALLVCLALAVQVWL